MPQQLEMEVMLLFLLTQNLVFGILLVYFAEFLTQYEKNGLEILNHYLSHLLFFQNISV